MAKVRESVLQVDVNERGLYCGAESEHAGNESVVALGDSIAQFENAILLKDGAEAVRIAIEIAWLARDCGLRRGDSANISMLTRDK